MFFVELEGHQNDKRLARAIEIAWPPQRAAGSARLVRQDCAGRLRSSSRSGDEPSPRLPSVCAFRHHSNHSRGNRSTRDHHPQIARDGRNRVQHVIERVEVARPADPSQPRRLPHDHRRDRRRSESCMSLRCGRSPAWSKSFPCCRRTSWPATKPSPSRRSSTSAA